MVEGCKIWNRWLSLELQSLRVIARHSKTKKTKKGVPEEEHFNKPLLGRILLGKLFAVLIPVQE